MFRFIKQLLGLNATPIRPERRAERRPAVAPSGHRRATDAYFDSMHRMQAALSRRDYPDAAQFVRESLHHIPAWVKETCREYGPFRIKGIPALEKGGTILALIGDDKGLAQMRQVVGSLPELEAWTEVVQRHQRDRRLFEALMDLVTTQPNCLQTQVKGLIGEADGRRVAVLLAYLEKAGRIRRVKADRTYRLLLPDSPGIPEPPPKRVPRSHRTDRQPPKLHEIAVESLTDVALPRIPLRRDEAQAGRRLAAPIGDDDFELRDADWTIETVEKIPPTERIDIAFRRIYPTDSGPLLIDDLGKASGLGDIEAAAMRCDRVGRVAAKRSLLHGIYRVDVHPLGRGLIAMSADCVVHAYDHRLQPILETPLAAAPEISRLRKRFDIPDDRLKNHIRCVALAPDASRYLFTAADEAWCVDVSGQGLWGAKLPSEFRMEGPGWPPRPASSGVPPHYGGATFGREMEGIEGQTDATSHMSGRMAVGETRVSDWLYAAGFAARSNAIYLAGYSGRIVVVDENGRGVRVYDIGGVPRRLVETGDYLYLLTDTRLYVLRDDIVHAVVDVTAGGDVMVTQTSFGLLEKKSVRWYRGDGRYLGAVLSRDPIRRVYATEEGMAVETRRRRALIRGAPGWW